MPTLNWIGKEKVINYHNDVPYRILEKKYLFDKDGEHVDGDVDSDNMIIHGDNLEALKSLLPKCEGQIKCIYIDPPYNTGNEGWVYNDNVSDPKLLKWLGEVVGKEGEDLTRHDKWLCMMYPRLKILNKLLMNGGAIFISIDDNEQPYLRLICDEIFGSNHFAAQIIWEKAYSPRMDEAGFSCTHDYICCYVKGPKDSIKKELFRQDTSQFKFFDESCGKNYRRRSVRKEGSQSLRADRPNMYYPVIAPDGSDLYPIKPDGTEGRWRWSKDTYEKNVELGIVEWVKTNQGWQVYAKQYIEEDAYRPFVTMWKCDEVGHNHSASEEVKNMFGTRVFDNPKPKELIQKIITTICEGGDIVLDAFAGSGTTGHAAMTLLDKGLSVKFILIEMADYAEGITAERIKKVIKGYKKKDVEVQGIEGNFAFYELGERLFDDSGNINSRVPVNYIKEYIWYMETRSKFIPLEIENYLLGVDKNTAYYFIYDPQKPTTLDMNFLTQIKEKQDEYIIYADSCIISEMDLNQWRITFKKIPRDISKI